MAEKKLKMELGSISLVVQRLAKLNNQTQWSLSLTHPPLVQLAELAEKLLMGVLTSGNNGDTPQKLGSATAPTSTVNLVCPGLWLHG